MKLAFLSYQLANRFFCFFPGISPEPRRKVPLLSRQSHVLSFSLKVQRISTDMKASQATRPWFQGG